MKHIIVGTAGHIDHGKTTLIKALTGIDADRLKEEKQRGITIDIGFAFLTLPNNIELGIVDVPGHEKFVKNMLAGVGGIDLAILVIAADEGIMPQTEEHLAICDLLQIQRGLVAVTKTDLVEEEWTEMVIEEIREGLKGTFLQLAPIIPVSSKTRTGLDTLVQELENLAAQVQERNSEGVFRLPIDRIFTIKGFGTVATGTLISGSIRNEEVVEILPEHIKARVRNVQVHDTPVETAYAGQRTALNLHGLEKRSIQRGSVLCVPDLLTTTYMLDAYFTLIPKASKPLKHRSRIRFHHGTNEIMARVILFDREELLPGESTYVQIRLESPITAMARDRFIIRSYSPVITIGGGEILYIQPKKHKRSPQIMKQLQTLREGSFEDILSIYVENAALQPITPRTISGMLAVNERDIQEGLSRLIQQGKIINTDRQGIAVIHATHNQKIITQLAEVLEGFHQQFPLKSGMAKEELRKKLPADLPLSVFQQILDAQVTDGAICVEQKEVRKRSHQIQLTAAQQQIKHQLEQLYLSSDVQPPNAKDALNELGGAEKERQAIFRLLVETGTLIRVEGEIYYHKDVLEEMSQRIISYLKKHNEITIADVKNLFQLSRKYTVPLLAYLDTEGITIRKGDVRILRRND